MERKEFLKACGCALLGFGGLGSVARGAEAPACGAVAQEPDFIANWLNDLLDAAEETLDRAAQVRLLEGCGTGCFRRHQFKRDIARDGQGDLDKLIAAYDRNFEIWRDGDTAHIRYGKVSKKCYCPVGNVRPAKENDLLCECTRATHAAVFEAAMGRPFRVEILESIRRGGVTCHFLVHLS